MISYNFDTEGGNIRDLEANAHRRARDFFGPDRPFDIDIRVIEAPNLPNWFQGKAIAWEIGAE